MNVDSFDVGLKEFKSTLPLFKCQNFIAICMLGRLNVLKHAQ